MFKEFKAFIARGNVIDLAVGVVMGAAFSAIVGALVDNVIMPPIGLLLGGIDFSDFFVALNGQHYDSLKAAKDAAAPVVAYGIFLNAILKFLIVSVAVFVLVKGVHKLQAKANLLADPVSAAPTPTEALLGEIRDLLKTRPPGTTLPPL